MTTAIYGVGAMGGAILDGLTAHGDGDVLAVARTPERATELRERYADRPAVEVVDASTAAARADVHLVVVPLGPRVCSGVHTQNLPPPHTGVNVL